MITITVDEQEIAEAVADPTYCPVERALRFCTAEPWRVILAEGFFREPASEKYVAVISDDSGAITSYAKLPAEALRIAQEFDEAHGAEPFPVRPGSFEWGS